VTRAEAGDGPDSTAATAGAGEVVAGVVIQTAPGRASKVADRLASIDGLELVGDDGDARLAAVWRAPSGGALERAVEALVRHDEQVLGVFPTFVGSE
jgi:nitrate reductase NapAB chaperone NapD